MVLIYTYEFPTAIGGAGSFTLSLAHYLSRHDSKLVVLTQSFSKEDKHFDKSQLFRVNRIPRVKNILASYLLGLGWFLCTIIALKPKNILVTDILSQRVLSLAQLFINKGNVFLLSHGSEVITNYNEKGFKKLLFTSIYKKAALIIANSRHTKDLLVKRNIPEGKITVINPGLDSRWFKNGFNGEAMREKLGLKGNNVILTVARLSWRKGHDTLIALMPRLTEELPNIKYLVVGDGEDRERLKGLVSENNLEDRVIFVGKVASEKLIDYYDACDIFVMPSREQGNLTEGFGISFIEAGARGKPVIGMNIGGVEDAVIDGRTGYLVEPNDTEMLFSKIICLLKNKELAQKLGENARSFVYNKFYWEGSEDCLLNKVFK